jgi:hypothetical protein
MAHTLMLKFKAIGVEYMVAPYEADAQLARLSLTGYIAAVITHTHTHTLTQTHTHTHTHTHTGHH